MQKKVDHLAAMTKMDPSNVASLWKLMGSEREWMEQIEAALQTTWGGAEGYCKWLGIDAAKVAAYKLAMLE